MCRDPLASGQTRSWRTAVNNDLSLETTVQALASVRDPNVRSVHGGRLGAHSRHGCVYPESPTNVDLSELFLFSHRPGAHLPGSVYTFVSLFITSLPVSNRTLSFQNQVQALIPSPNSLQYAEDGTLRDFLKAHSKTLKDQDRKRFVWQLAAGMSYLHTMEVRLPDFSALNVRGGGVPYRTSLVEKSAPLRSSLREGGRGHPCIASFS